MTDMPAISLPQQIHHLTLEMLQPDITAVVAGTGKCDFSARLHERPGRIALYHNDGRILLRRDETLLHKLRALSTAGRNNVSCGLIAWRENDDVIIDIHTVWLDPDKAVRITDHSQGARTWLMATPVSHVLRLTNGNPGNQHTCAHNPDKKWKDWPRSTATHGDHTIYSDRLEEHLGFLEPSWQMIRRTCPIAAE